MYPLCITIRYDTLLNMKTKQHIIAKRDEIIMSLGQQDYSLQEIADMYTEINKAKVFRIIKKTPEGWKSPWIKIK